MECRFGHVGVATGLKFERLVNPRFDLISRFKLLKLKQQSAARVYSGFVV